ncbi:MAG TPA: hypothetical protein VGK67_22575 [Myxococcales bacterium]|jgi:hypothetical protein
MRLVVLAMVLSLASPALAAEVRVKSKHEKAQLQGMSQDAYKVGAEETLRAGVIGPSTVKVSLRRIGDGKLPQIPVKLMRDGREVGRLTVGGKLSFAVAGDTVLASAPVTKTLDIPAGPHTLFVEVGAGQGLILVSFDEQAGAALVAKANEPAKTEPKMAKAEPAKASPGKLEDSEPKPAEPAKAEPKVIAKAEPKPAKAEPKVAKAEPKVAKAEPKPAEPAKSEPKVAKTGPKAEPKPAEPAKTEPKVAQAEQPKASPSKLEDSEPAPKATPSKLEDSEPAPAAKPEIATAGKLEEPDSGEPAAAATRPAETPSGLRKLHVFLGPRLGGAAQTQVGAIGPAVGLSFRWAVVGGSTRNGTRGLLLGLSADMLRYSIAMQMPASSPLGEATPTMTAISVPILVEATYSFGNTEQAQLTPYLGISLGLAAGDIKLEGPVQESQGFARFAAGAHLGLEIPIGDNRLGVEARYLWSQIGGDGTVKDLDVGGVLIQASWRFGI